MSETYKCGCADAEEEADGTLKLPPGEDLLGPLPGHGTTTAKSEKKHSGAIKEEASDGTLEETTNPELRGVKLEVEG